MPSTKARIITTLDKGSEVWGVSSKNNNWLQVSYKGQKAYVWAEYVK